MVFKRQGWTLGKPNLQGIRCWVPILLLSSGIVRRWALAAERWLPSTRQWYLRGKWRWAIALSVKLSTLIVLLDLNVIASVEVMVHEYYGCCDRSWWKYYLIWWGSVVNHMMVWSYGHMYVYMYKMVMYVFSCNCKTRLVLLPRGL